MGYTKVITWSDRINTNDFEDTKRDDGFCNSTSSNHSLPKTSQRRVTIYPQPKTPRSPDQVWLMIQALTHGPNG